MCQLWPQKFMACGHIHTNHLVYCEAFLATPQAPCEIYIQGADEIGCYTPGDPLCNVCNASIACQVAMDNAWYYTLALAVDNRNYNALQNARSYLKSINYITPNDTYYIHEDLMKQYLTDGTVMDIDAALGQRGYFTPSMLNPSQPSTNSHQPQGTVVMTREEEAIIDASKVWEVLSISSDGSDANQGGQEDQPLPELTTINDKIPEVVVNGSESSDEHEFWEAMDFDNDVGSVLGRLEEEMDLW